ncbi:hypothetical protein ABR31_0202230 [Enterobacter kobei]|nr:hypothetical protein ABR31_0202230 [Enterobacter kobei]
MAKRKEAGTTEKCLFFGVNHGHLWLTASSLLLVHQNVSIIVLSKSRTKKHYPMRLLLWIMKKKHYGLLKRLKQIALQ